MGVTGQRKNPYRADVGEDHEPQEIITTYLEEPSEPQYASDLNQTPVKKARRYRPRYWYVDNIKAKKTKNGIRAARRTDHLNQLLIAEGLDVEDFELEFLDFIEPSASHFSELFEEQEKMMMWNDFINRGEEEQQRILSGMSWDSDDDDDVLTCLEDNEKWEKIELRKSSNSWEHLIDKRTVHPGFSADECFKRIDSGLRSMLKKRHLPKGTLSNLEEELVSFFKEWPSSIYISKLPSSYERLLTHALCQYLDLNSKSFDDDHGVRQTQVENPHLCFSPPQESLTQYLETKH